jgi:hypothetical protein
MTMRMISLAAIAAVAIATPSLGMAQTQSAFNPSAFNWTDPSNYEVSATASGYQNWTLRDPAARAYLRQAIQTGQFCLYGFKQGNKDINLRIPKISPACPRR